MAVQRFHRQGQVVMTPKFQGICNTVRELKRYPFKVLCNDYLKARYPNLILLGVGTIVHLPIGVNPDAFGLDESGDLIACQYSAQESDWRGKPAEDANKVAEVAVTSQVTVGEFIFWTIAEEDPAVLVAQQPKIENLDGFPVETG